MEQPMQNILFRHFQSLFMCIVSLVIVMFITACTGDTSSTGQSAKSTSTTTSSATQVPPTATQPPIATQAPTATVVPVAFKAGGISFIGPVKSINSSSL